VTIEPQIIGVVNITEDSFSDGGRYLSREEATRYAFELVDAGADVIELGPASTHPSAQSVSASQEIRRVAGVVPALQKRQVTIAIDSVQPDTQRYAIAQGVEYLNDTTGFANPEMYAELADSSSKLVVMHSILRDGRGTREFQDPVAVLAAIYAFFDNRLSELEAAGIARSRIIIDPGMGFFLGGNPEPSIRVLRELRRLKASFGLPVLVSVSRKSFLGAITGRDVHERGAATLAAEIFCALQGTDYIRTHDVRSLRDALKVMNAIGFSDAASFTGEHRRL
jgi:dihydropteroate synthase